MISKNINCYTKQLKMRYRRTQYTQYTKYTLPLFKNKLKEMREMREKGKLFSKSKKLRNCANNNNYVTK